MRPDKDDARTSNRLAKKMESMRTISREDMNMEDQINTIIIISAVELLFFIVTQIAIVVIVGSMIGNKLNEGYSEPQHPGMTPPRSDESLDQVLRRAVVQEEGWHPLPTRGSQSGIAVQDRGANDWKAITAFKVPVNLAVDVKTKRGTIYTRCYLNSSNPEQWEPEFIKYKDVKWWKYSA